MCACLQLVKKVHSLSLSCWKRKNSVLLALVGSAKNPNCLSMCDRPPIAYTNQENAWFDRSTTVWWFKNVFLTLCRNRWGDDQVILILDNCPCHLKIVLTDVPENIVIIYLPENLTSRHQPCDLGIIAKSWLPNTLS